MACAANRIVTPPNDVASFLPDSQRMVRHVFPDLVVVLPGLIGSSLEKDGKAIWGTSPGAIWRLVAGSALEQIELKGQDDEREDLGDGVVASGLVSDVELVPGLVKLDGYTVLARRLLKIPGLEQGRNYRQFPYDWRRSNRVSARRLAKRVPDWLRHWRETSGNANAKVIFVAHSMGGLVARYYIECLEGWRDTRTLLTFGTPYRGSGNALGYLCNGFSWDVGPLKAFDGTAALRSFDSVYQLLPTYPFVDIGSGSLLRVAELDLPNLDGKRARAAAEFHEEIRRAQEANAKLEDYDLRGPKVRPVVGIEQTTFQSARWGDGALTLLTSHEGADLHGDATVPRASAIPLELSKEAAMYAPTRHGQLQSDEATFGHLRGVLGDGEVDLSKYRLSEIGTIDLRVSDAYASDQPVTISAAPSEYVQTLDAVVTSCETGEAIETVLRPNGDLHSTQLRLKPGLFRVRVSGKELRAVSDVFLVPTE